MVRERGEGEEERNGGAWHGGGGEEIRKVGESGRGSRRVKIGGSGNTMIEERGTG